MFELLDRQTTLTGNQKRIVACAMLGNMLDFFDYALIAYVLAFVVGPWRLTYGESAIILLSSGIGATAGGFFWGWFADRIGRRPAFLAGFVIISLATSILALTPERAWLFLSFFRLVMGFGMAGLYSVGFPLVQEFIPASKRGFISGLVTAFVPIGVLLGAVAAAYLTRVIGWRGLFAMGLLPCLLVPLVRSWARESPRWLMQMGRAEEARRSLAWALEIDPDQIELPQMREPEDKLPFSAIFRFPRSLALSWLGNLGGQTAAYGVTLWTPTLLVLLLKIPPARAAYLLIFSGFASLAGRLIFSYLSERIGRRPSAILGAFGSAAAVLAAGVFRNNFIEGASVFLLFIIIFNFFDDGGFAIYTPYAAEVWPSRLRATGVGSAYGFGGLGKIIGPAGLALIVGSSNVIDPAVTPGGILPAFVYLACWPAFAGLVYLILGFETKGRSFESIDWELQEAASVRSLNRAERERPI